MTLFKGNAQHSREHLGLAGRARARRRRGGQTSHLGRPDVLWLVRGDPGLLHRRCNAERLAGRRAGDADGREGVLREARVVDGEGRRCTLDKHRRGAQMLHLQDGEQQGDDAQEQLLPLQALIDAAVACPLHPSKDAIDVVNAVAEKHGEEREPCDGRGFPSRAALTASSRDRAWATTHQ